MFHELRPRNLRHAQKISEGLQNRTDFYRLPRLTSLLKNVKKRFFRIALPGSIWVFYGFFYMYLGTMNTMKIAMTDPWGCFLVSWHHIL